MTPTELLSHTLPALPAGPGRRALLAYLLTALEGYPDWTPTPQELLKWRSQLSVAPLAVKTDSPRGAEEDARLVGALKQKMLKRWPVWGPAVTWGWEPLFQAAQGLHQVQVQKWLAHPNAPSPQELSTRLFPFAMGGKRAPAQVTLLGAALWGANAYAKSDELFRLVQVLLKKGVDPAAPVDSWGTSAVEAAPTALVSRLLVKGSAGVSKPLLFGWIEPKAPLEAIKRRLHEVVTLYRSPEGQQGLPALEAGFPDLVERVALRLALHVPTQPMAQDPRSDWFQITKQVRALGRIVGQDCWKPSPTGVSLAGAWARACVLVAGDSRYATTADRLNPVGSLLMGSHWNAWGGQAGGLPARIWGQLALPLSSIRGQEQFDALQGPAQDWEGLSEALRCLPPSPHVWRVAVNWACLDRGMASDPLLGVREKFVNEALGVLAPAVWSSGLQEEQRHALYGETMNHKAALKEALLRMGRNIGARVMADKTDQPEIEVEKALALYVLAGWKDPQGAVRLVKWCRERSVPFDPARVVATMDSPFVSAQLREVSPSQRAAFLEMVLKPVTPKGPKPRF